ncbi:hypothetical protein [Nocardia concava]|uniref:hypothetical protein n=1 Tax=Nocardia concava TaxID=257281 RepID=UPI0002F98D3E|nr:hypothetical protein [Nocardia concava]
MSGDLEAKSPVPTLRPPGDGHPDESGSPVMIIEGAAATCHPLTHRESNPR